MEYRGDPVKPVIICGSIAIDHLGTYSGSFDDYQARYPIKGLNISLQLNALETSFGGCGMNIVYGLGLLQVPVIPISAAGQDFNDHYLDHLHAIGIDCRYIAVDEAFEHSAQCIIFTDDSGNQITAFNSGASVSEKRLLPSAVADIDQVALALLAPEDALIMLRQAKDLYRKKIPSILDPGQGVAEFARDEIRELLSLTQYVIVNNHEWQILQTNADKRAEEIIATHEVIVTRGKHGVDIYKPGADSAIHVAAAQCESPLDPTGCGDAFRAGYIFGLLKEFETRQCAELGCLMAVYNLETAQTQHYQVTEEQLMLRHREVYGKV